MELFNCLHPKKIRCKDGHGYQYVGCGKCPACRSQKAKVWTSRLIAEAEQSMFVVFFTLTYDDKNLPFFVYDFKDDSLIDYKNGPDYSLSDLSDYLDNRSRLYLAHRKKIGYLCSSDIQNFVKRCRSFLNYKLDNHETSSFIRYYICGEYGPTTHRPHYHGLFFFNNFDCKPLVEEMFSSCWTFGHFDWSFSTGQQSLRYVASYVNGLNCLPKIFTCPVFRPFSLCSKKPPLGSLREDVSALFDIFERTVVEYSRYNENRQLVYLPMRSEIVNMLFPKCVGFSNLSHLDRLFLYGISKYFNAESFDAFQEKVTSSCKSLFFSPTLGLEYLFKSVAHNSVHRPNKFGSYLQYSSSTNMSLYSLWLTSCKVIRNCELFGCTLDYYVCKIEKFYSKFNLKKLKRYYEFQEAFSALFGAQPLIYLDLAYLDKLHEFMSVDSERDSVDRLILSGFSIDYDSYVNNPSLIDLSFQSRSEFKSLVAKYHDIFRQSSKTKVKNDYLEANDRFDSLSQFNSNPFE